MENNLVKVYSQHHFMFPFRWDILPIGFGLDDIKENEPFDKRTKLSSFEESFGNWKRKQYDIKNAVGEIDPNAYNTFTYFHEFAQKTIFDFEYPWKKNQDIIRYYEYTVDEKKENFYEIEHLEKTNKNDWNCKKYHTKTLKLRVDGITLHIFNTGVGVLSYDLSNIKPEQRHPHVILKINDYGRRMYPQYLNLNAVKENFLANKITLQLNDHIIEDDFSIYDDGSIVSTVEPYRLPKFIQQLFPDKFIFRTTPEKLKESKILITKVTDDRMFFQCWYGNKSISEDITTTFKANNKINSDWLYAYIFGDKETNSSIANSELQKEQLNTNVYKRWIGWNTVYGISRDSFVCLTDEADFGYNHLRIHMQGMYYNISILCLAQRASILKFTTEVANITDLAKLNINNDKEKKHQKEIIENIKELYKNYIEFINKIYFREITPQIQGIEIYTQFQKILNIENEIKDLDNEISELHNYVSLLQDKERNDEAHQLNQMAGIFLPATLMFSILGANFYSDDNFLSNFISLPSLIWIAIGCIPSIYFYYKIKNQ
ncbi:MAG TPA: hypothetical protein PLK15_01575 [Chitinophagales bacterium]|jgi:hypothetical protein|nr:hypothetical protein [Chitinophagales bacterium]